MLMKGIILAGGKGTRLHPVSHPISKSLLPIYNKPMIYYPLSTLMLAGIRDILIITNEKDNDNFKTTLGDGSLFGIRLSYAIQYEAKGIADAFIIGKEFINGDRVALILGDNIFHGESMMALLEKAMKFKKGGVIFVFGVPDPERFGVAELDSKGNVISLEEKPKHPKSNCAVTGLYFYDGDVCDIASSLKASGRGELEITDLNKVYLERKALKAYVMDRGYRWLDAGTFDSLTDASVTVRNIETKKRRMISCPEEIALMQGFITSKELKERIKDKDSMYYEDLRKIADEYS